MVQERKIPVFFFFFVSCNCRSLGIMIQKTSAGPDPCRKCRHGAMLAKRECSFSWYKASIRHVVPNWGAPTAAAARASYAEVLQSLVKNQFFHFFNTFFI